MLFSPSIAKKPKIFVVQFVVLETNVYPKCFKFVVHGPQVSLSEDYFPQQTITFEGFFDVNKNSSLQKKVLKFACLSAIRDG